MFKKLSIIFLLLITLTNVVYAKEITLDGKMNDWNDKPTYENKGQKMLMSWFLDDESMDLYIRFWDKAPDFGTNKMYIMIDKKQYTADFKLNYEGEVTVALFDPDGKRIWNTSGNWGKKNESGDMEFYIPLKTILPTNGWGYEIKFRAFIKWYAYLPADEWVVISTASTMPIVGSSIAILVAGLLAFFCAKRKKKKTVNN